MFTVCLDPQHKYLGFNLSALKATFYQTR
uniref:Uncharacterized protein n=1 Tax=Anguilla anguilla TaxID=7936 RepID=A0A0E9XQA0_ANGAN